MRLPLLLLTLLTGCSADRLILGENQDPIDSPGLTRVLLHQPDDHTLECFTLRSAAAQQHPSEPPAAYVLFFVGKGDRAERWTTAVANVFADKPVEVWSMNYPGSGQTTGPPSLAQTAADALALYDHVLAQTESVRRNNSHPPPTRIFLYAASFGTAPALHVAAHRPVAGLVLQNPPPLRQLILGHYGWWNLWLLALPLANSVPKELDSIANAHNSTAPAIFTTAGKDQTIPPKYHRQIINAYQGPKRVVEIPTADHNSPLTREAAAQLTDALKWLWQTTPSPPQRPHNTPP